ncbi:hypothetical protein [Alteriqipengyuania abyssalis]
MRSPRAGTSLPRTSLADMPHVVRLWALLALILLLVSAGRIAHWQFPDPDDILRLVQVRDLLGGQGWFDLDQHRIDPLREVPMHWSRLVDIPLALVIGALTPLVGQGAAEGVALIAVPLLTLLVAMAFVAPVAIRLFGRETGGWTVLVAGMMPLLSYQFQPLRIDHHGWQIACFAAAFWGLSQGERARGPIVAGIAMASGLMISIETLPLAALVGAILALRWLRDPSTRLGLTHYLQALAGGLIVLYLATRGWPQVAQYCDAITPAHLGFFLVVALGTSALSHARPLPPIAVLGALGAIGAGGVALFGAASPACLATPFGSLDPLVHDYWYVHVSEGRPVWEQSATIIPALLQLALAFAVAVRLWLRAPMEQRAQLCEFLLLFAGTLALGLLVSRSLAFASLLATVPVAWLLGEALHRLRTARKAIPKLAVGVATVLALLPMAPVALAENLASTKPPAPRLTAQVGGVASEEPVSLIAESSCDLQASANRLAALPRGTVFAPLDIGPTVLLETEHRVVATGHHRAEAAMHDVIGAFLVKPEVSREILRSYGADYLVLCDDLAEPALYAKRGGSRSLAARLLADDAPAWLAKVETGAPASFRVWKVRN